MKKTVSSNPEFGVELALVIPYAYWLHKRGELGTVVTSKGMEPFYYFCDDVRALNEYRTIDNTAANMNEFPNNWIHGIDPLDNPGVLDYEKWECPPYAEIYRNDKYVFGKPTICIVNKYNVEHGEEPMGFFDLQALYNMVTMLKDKYHIIYKRHVNQRDSNVALDQNEMNTITSTQFKLLAEDPEGNVIDDFGLMRSYFPYDVTLMDDLIGGSNQYNHIQLQVMANCAGFISVCGGNSILCSMFGKPVISYVHKGKELRPGYFGPNSYFRKLSGADIYPVFDVIAAVNRVTYDHEVNYSGTNDYTKLFETINKVFL